MTDLTESQRVQRGHHAKRALEEFLDPAFRIVAEEYQERLQDVASRTPWDAAKITALANALRIVAEVHNQIAGLVYDGEHAKKGMIRAEKIEELTPARRRLVEIGCA